jgi:hypothetical protein
MGLIGSNERGSRSFFDTFRCLGSAFITFSFGTITVRVLTLGVVSLRAIATTLWLVPMISSKAANLASAFLSLLSCWEDWLLKNENDFLI